MIAYVLAASAYLKDTNLCFSFISKKRDLLSGTVVVLDASGIQRLSCELDPDLSARASIVLIEFSEWLEVGVPIAHKIRSSIQGIGPDKIILVNAAGYSGKLISDALLECRYVWFSLSSWHVAFALICDDLMVSRFSREIYDTFHVRPNDFDNSALRRAVAMISRRAFLVRWLGFSWLLRRIGRSLPVTRWLFR